MDLLSLPDYPPDSGVTLLENDVVYGQEGGWKLTNALFDKETEKIEFFLAD